MAKAPNLELRNIQRAKNLSEETPAYTADVYLDGKKACEVENHGHGGCDRQHWFDSKARERIEAYFKALPAKTMTYVDSGFDMQPDLESWCHHELEVLDVLKSLKRSLKRKVSIMTADGKEWSFPKLPPEALDDNTKAWIAKKYPGCTFLNGMNDAGLRRIIDILSKR